MGAALVTFFVIGGWICSGAVVVMRPDFPINYVTARVSVVVRKYEASPLMVTCATSCIIALRLLFSCQVIKNAEVMI